VLATRVRAFKSIGDFPDFTYFGGNSEMRGYDYLQFSGQNAVFANAELRFPIIEAALTPIGVVGGIRGVFFANIGGGWFNDQPSGAVASNCGDPKLTYKFFSNNTMVCTPVLGYVTDAAGFPVPNPIDPSVPLVKYGPPIPVNGFRLQDGRASYGIGLETFALGFPIHFDWSWRTLFNKAWENVLFAAGGGSNEFRAARFAVWIGYDF
jgi:outer membrane protein assembly factor BamA